MSDSKPETPAKPPINVDPPEKDTFTTPTNDDAPADGDVIADLGDEVGGPA